jgi:hypothetical protein
MILKNLKFNIHLVGSKKIFQIQNWKNLKFNIYLVGSKKHSKYKIEKSQA